MNRTQSAKRKGPEEFFVCALQVLDEPGGTRDLTIATLCHRLTVTKGSFYHHFAGWDDFVKGLMDYWEAQQIERTSAQLHKAQTAALHLGSIVELASNVPHRTENAIRAWAITHEVVAQAQARIDARRVAYAEVLLSYLVNDLPFVKRLATMSIALFIGLQHMEPRPDPEQIRDIMNGYLHEVVGPALDKKRPGVS